MRFYLKHPQIKKVSIYSSDKKKALPFSDFVNDYYIRIIERLLSEQNFTIEEKIELINTIISCHN